MIHKSFNVLPLCQGHYMPAVIIPQVIERRLTLCAFHHFAVWGKCHHQTSGVSLSVMTVSGTGRVSVLGGSLLVVKVWQTTIHIWVAPCTKMQMPKIESMKTRNPNPRKAKVTATGTSSDEIYNGLLVDWNSSRQKTLDYNNIISCCVMYHSLSFPIFPNNIGYHIRLTKAMCHNISLRLWDFAVYMTHMANKFYYWHETARLWCNWDWSQNLKRCQQSSGNNLYE